MLISTGRKNSAILLKKNTQMHNTYTNTYVCSLLSNVKPKPQVSLKKSEAVRFQDLCTKQVPQHFRRSSQSEEAEETEQVSAQQRARNDQATSRHLSLAPTRGNDLC